MIFKHQLLTPRECLDIQQDLNILEWSPGFTENPTYADQVKKNKEIGFGAANLSDIRIREITAKIFECREFLRSHFPKHLANPRFNLYENGGAYHRHADSGFMGKDPTIRTDISMTLFLSEPDEYEGGELSLEYPNGYVERIKGEMGEMVAYPSGVMHQVLPVTDGQRIAFVCWFESQIGDERKRNALVEITKLCDDFDERDDLRHGPLHTQALNVKHNLFRMWWRSE